MPNYNYTCDNCFHTQVEFRKISNRKSSTKCLVCGHKSKHSLSAPSLILTLPQDRWANEHEVLGNGIRSGV